MELQYEFPTSIGPQCIKEDDMEESASEERSVLTEKYAEESAQRACRTEALEERDA